MPSGPARCRTQPGAPAVAGRLVERSKGKDTTTGHWELMGVVTAQAFPTYPHGFPHDVIDPFMHRTGRGVLGNKPASGTEIIQELGEEHQRSGKWIVYTSADSVFQIAAHEDTIPVEELYDAFAGCDIDESHVTRSNVEGITQTEQLLRSLDDGLIFTNLVETDMLWGHRNDPVNFHRCLQDFDRRLPDLLDALQSGDLLILTSDHGCDPTTASTDHSREHALLIAHVVGLPAASGRHDGDTFGDVGATVQQHLLGRHDDDLPGTPVL